MAAELYEACSRVEEAGTAKRERLGLKVLARSDASLARSD